MSDRPPVPVKCLLVDDLPENLVVLAALLRRPDVVLLEARSGAEALELLLVNDVALAVLDVQMPEMDGFELAELMRGSERTRHIPIIFVTAGVRDPHRLFQGYDLGAVDFLYKPIDAHVLQSKAEVFFTLYRQKQWLERELHERTETLRLNEMFAAVLGHDLRAPLSAVITGATLLQRRSEDPFVHDVASRILSSSTRMGRMIEDLLDLARVRLAGGMVVTRQAVDLEAILRRVVQEQQASFPNRPVIVTHRGNATGHWDPDRLGQMIANLVGNALQHGEAGESICVDLEGTRPDAVSVSISNAGLIDPALLPHLFDPFRGGQRPVTRNAGLGLGLYIAQQIAHAHGGRIDVESGVGRTVFRISVPRELGEGGVSDARVPPS